MIGASTRVVGLLGHPVGHSLSPRVHNHVLATTGHDAVYLAFDVPPKRLAAGFTGLRALGAIGWNLTIPHKEAALSLLDTVAPDAAAIGAVNTIVVAEDKLVGHNTDAGGFRDALEVGLGLDPTGLRVLVLGAGGAARAVVASLVGTAAVVYVAARRPAAAERLAATTGARIAGHARDLTIDLVVNATPVGMEGGPAPRAIPIDLGEVPGVQAVMDLVYGANDTPLVARARAMGLAACGGEVMLAAQARRSFALWFNDAPPIDRFLEPLHTSSDFGSTS